MHVRGAWQKVPQLPASGADGSICLDGAARLARRCCHGRGHSTARARGHGRRTPFAFRPRCHLQSRGGAGGEQRRRWPSTATAGDPCGLPRRLPYLPARPARLSSRLHGLLLDCKLVRQCPGSAVLLLLRAAGTLRACPAFVPSCSPSSAVSPQSGRCQPYSAAPAPGARCGSGDAWCNTGVDCSSCAPDEVLEGGGLSTGWLILIFGGLAGTVYAGGGVYVGRRSDPGAALAQAHPHIDACEPTVAWISLADH